MSIEPPDSLHHVYSLLNEESPLLRASFKMLKEADANAAVSTESRNSTDGSHLHISTSQIIKLFQRFRMRDMSFDQLMNLPLSQLSPTEKNFVLYLRKNPNIFRQMARLDRNPGTLSPQDIKIAAQLAGDSMVLSDEDLQYLRSITQADPGSDLEANGSETPPALQSQRASGRLEPAPPDPSRPPDAEALARLLNKLSPQPVTPEQLHSLNPESLDLQDDEARQLDFLRSRPVLRMLESLVRQTDGVITPEILRILTSLIWNPAVYAALPLVFMKEPRPAAPEKSQPVTATLPVDDEEDSYLKRASRLHIEMHAATIIEICKRINPKGHVTLEQLRAYQPADIEEARILNHLKQLKIFHVLADLDSKPDTLSEKDIRIAVASGAILVYDPYIMLLILP